MSSCKMKATSKRSDWKLKEFYLRPETAKRLRSYVNRLQEDDQNLDASDVADVAIRRLLQIMEEQVSDIAALTLRESDSQCKVSWGHWRFKPDKLTIVYREWYAVDLKQINSSAKMRDTIWQFRKDLRNVNVWDLVRAFRDIFYPHVCHFPWSPDKVFSGSELAKRYRLRAYSGKSYEKKKRKQIPSKLRYSIFERDGFCCKACGISAGDGAILHVDHRIAVANGGTNDPDNLQALCSDCNLGKGAR